MIKPLTIALILFVASVVTTAHDDHHRKALEAEVRQLSRLARIEIICAAKHPVAGFDGCVDGLVAQSKENEK